MILGLGDPDEYKSTLKPVLDRGSSTLDICLLRPPISDDDEDNPFEFDLKIPFSESSLNGLFVPKSKTSPNRLSYVDIVQKRVTSTGNEIKMEPPLSPTIGSRKVSNASSISTQAEDDWGSNIKEGEPEDAEDKHGIPYQEDLTSLDSDFSELACTTRQRKLRMDGRRKEMQAKKYENGLLAAVPCPSEEPDRSPHSPQ
jgi:hypothetical protein